MKFPSGIYLHYKRGDLYFATEVREDHDTGDLWVNYNALYPGTLWGYTKKLFLFRAKVPDANNKPVSRFTLIQELPPEKMQILLPGTLLMDSKKEKLSHKLIGVFFDHGIIIAKLETLDHGISLKFDVHDLLSGQFSLRAE